MNAKPDKTGDNSPTTKKSSKKASTNELPMVDLDTVLGFVDKIEADGLQTLSQSDVAKRLGYATQTSTPFYRRTVAARLFGLIDTTQGVNLTKLALDYFKPIDEESKRHALVIAVKNVVGYTGIIERFSGKRLPPLDILKNSIEREFELTSETANACADVFVRSVKSAGLVKSDGTLWAAGTDPPSSQMPSERASSQIPIPVTQSLSSPSSDDLESHYLTLDAKRGRRVILQAPPIITSAELKRIQNWLAVQFHVVDSLDPDASERQPAVINDPVTTAET
jgi:hypothetical protein